MTTFPPTERNPSLNKTCACTSDPIINLIKLNKEAVLSSPHYATLKGAQVNTLGRILISHKYKVWRNDSYLNDPCPIIKRIAQTASSSLSSLATNSENEMENWILILLLLASDKTRKFIDPLEGKYQKILIYDHPIGIIRVPLRADLKSGTWVIESRSLRRIIQSSLKQLKGNELRRRTNRILLKAKKHIFKTNGLLKLPKVPFAPWIKHSHLNPENFHRWGLKTFKQKPSIYHNNSESHISILACNIRSLNTEKALLMRATSHLNQVKPDVYIFNEVRSNEGLNLFMKSHKIYSSILTPGKAGAAIVISNSLPVTQSDTGIDNTVILTLEIQGAVLILATTYIPPYVKDKSKILKLCLENMNIEAKKYENPLVLFFGDLNTPPNKVEQSFKRLEHLTATAGLKIHTNYDTPSGFPSLMTRVGQNKQNNQVFSRLDYILSNTNLQISTQHHPKVSDHIIFSIKLLLHKTTPRKNTVIARKKLIYELQLITNPKNLSDMINYITKYKKCFEKTSNIANFGKDIHEFLIPLDAEKTLKAWIQEFKLFAKQLSKLRFTMFQKEAFNILRRVTKYDQFLKRDGSIISSLRSGSQIITNKEEVEQALILYLKNIDESLNTSQTLPNKIVLPSLPPINSSVITDLINEIPQHKALAPFPFPDEMLSHFKSENNVKILEDCWNPQFIEMHPELLACKLVPLNKVHPCIPSANQMRPIVATNCIFKVIESRFLHDLQQKFWKLSGLAQSQCGFLPHMNTQVQIYSLLSQVTKDRKLIGTDYIRNRNSSAEETFILFLDYEQAYNSINMQKLHERMLRAEILPQDSTDFIFGIFQRLSIHLGKNSYSPTHGVPQGGRLSPILFNYAMFFMLDEVKSSLDLEYAALFPRHIQIFKAKEVKLWADDFALAFRTPLLTLKEKLKLLLKTLMAIGSQWGLRINFKKSGLMHLFTRNNNYSKFSDSTINTQAQQGVTLISLNLSSSESVTLPLVRKYKYLGIYINRNLRISDHISFLKKKINYIANSLISVRKASNSTKFCYNTWQIFIRPLLDYTNTYVNFVPQKDKELIWALYRGSLKKMLFMKPYIPNALTELLIQYDIRKLPLKYCNNAKKKLKQRKEGEPDKKILAEKVNYEYWKIHPERLTPAWIRILNTVFRRGQCHICKNYGFQVITNPEHMRKHIRDRLKFDIYELFIDIAIDETLDVSLYEDKLHKFLMTAWD